MLNFQIFGKCSGKCSRHMLCSRLWRNPHSFCKEYARKRHSRLENFLRGYPDPLLTQNRIGAGRAGRKQQKICRANSGKKGKSEPKRLRFAIETTYGPEGHWFESSRAYQVVLPKDAAPENTARKCGVFSFYSRI